MVDTSGSMEGGKISQVQKSLTYCLNALDPQDRFNIIPFSTDAYPFAERLIEVKEANVEAAKTFVNELEAAGGTNISAALTSALSNNDRKAGRVFQVLFLTDGLPTVGTRDPKSILAETKKVNTAGVRLFALGVGQDVNTFLLDKLSEENRGTRDYVLEEEDLEVKISGLYQKIAHPALVDVKLSVDGVTIKDQYPRSLPDLFYGSDLLVFGRYEGQGPAKLTLEGQRYGKPVRFEYELRFDEIQLENKYLPRLWATRKVGFLLDEIRLHGSDKELVDEVTRLGTTYGIVTPYTSNLAVEEEDLARLDTFGLMSPGQAGRRLGELRSRGGRGGGGGLEAKRRLEQLGYISSGGAAATGENAVRDSLALGRLKGATALGSDDAKSLAGKKSQSVKTIDGHRFIFLGGVWVDQRYDATKHTTAQKIVAFSDEYFELLTKAPTIAPYLTLGTRLLLVWEGKALEIIEGTE